VRWGVEISRLLWQSWWGFKDGNKFHPQQYRYECYSWRGKTTKQYQTLSRKARSLHVNTLGRYRTSQEKQPISEKEKN
jgi:hypothetical protein